MNAANPTLPLWARLSAGGRLLALSPHVQPGARHTGPVGRHGDALRFRVAAPADRNRANQALLDYLHETLQLPKSNLRIVQGMSSRRKRIEVDIPHAQALARLAGWDKD